MLIPENRQQDILDVFWVLLRTIESTATDKDVLDRRDVECGYRILRDIGYYNLYPRWEK